jgi:hypothetical protein
MGHAYVRACAAAGLGLEPEKKKRAVLRIRLYW